MQDFNEKDAVRIRSKTVFGSPFDSTTVDQQFLACLETDLVRVFDEAKRRDYSQDEFRAAVRYSIFGVQTRRGHPGIDWLGWWCEEHAEELDAIAKRHRSHPYFTRSVARRVLLGTDLPRLIEDITSQPDGPVVLEAVRDLVARSRKHANE